MSAVIQQSAREVEKALRKIGTKEKAKSSSWFFKTEKGQYGYGDFFIGVTVPEQRKIAKDFSELKLSELKKLLYSRYHECRLTSLLILTEQFKKADSDQQKKLFDFYILHKSRVNNWDLVDSSAPTIVGGYLLHRSKRLLYKLARSQDLWDKRISIIATYFLIQNQQFEDTISIAKILLHDSHDLIHKAVGWMLREAGKRDKTVLISFLNEHAHEMPRTMLRYSIEKLSPIEKKRYMTIKK